MRRLFNAAAFLSLLLLVVLPAAAQFSTASSNNFPAADQPDADSTLIGADYIGPFGQPGDQLWGEFDPRPDTDVHRLQNPYSTLMLLRLYTEDRARPFTQRAVASNLFVWNQRGTLFARWGYLDDQRPQITFLTEPGEEYYVGLGSSRSHYTADSLAIADTLFAMIPDYALTGLHPRRVRGDHVVAAQGDISRLDDPRIQTLGQDSPVELAEFYRQNDPSWGPDPGEVMRHVYRVGDTIDGCYARVYGTIGQSIAQIRPDGTVVESARYGQIRWNDYQVDDGYPLVYPPQRPADTGYDPGAALFQPLEVGNFVAIGLFVGSDGSVRNSHQGPMELRLSQSAAPARRDLGHLQILCPDFTPAPDPVTVTSNEVQVRWTASTQCAAVQVDLSTGQSIVAELGPVGTEGDWWSRSATENDIDYFEVRVPLGDIIPVGTAISWTATPLCAGVHWDYTAQEQLAFQGLATVVVSNDENPAATGFDMVVTPNPVRFDAQVQLTLVRPSDVTVTVFDVLGRQVALVHQGNLPAGQSQFDVSARTFPPGTYIVRATTSDDALTTKLTVVR